jgi:replicative DNA helicase
VEAPLKDKIPPHHEEAEKAALGGMLLDNEAVIKSVSRLREDDFYSLANGKIFAAIKCLYDKGGQTADIISVCDELTRRKQLDAAGGAAYVSGLTNVVPTAANIDYYIDLIKDRAMRRALITIASKIIAKSYEISESAEVILETAQQFIFELIEDRQQFHYKSIREVINNTLPYMDEMLEKEYTGIQCGFPEIDRITRGFQKSEMIVIGARPSIGKTALALNMAANIAFQHRIPTAFFSLEMRDTLLGMRFLSSEAQIDMREMRAQLEAERGRSYQTIINAAERIYKAPLFIEDASNMKLMDLRTQARHIRRKEKVEIIFIDYLGLIDNQNGLPRFEQVSEISRSIKSLARELDIPIVVLSQVGRGSEGVAPTIANLRDSGSVEQDADVVILLHRERKLAPDSEHNYFETDIDIAKNRNGPTKSVRLAYHDKFTRFNSIQG